MSGKCVSEGDQSLERSGYDGSGRGERSGPGPARGHGSRLGDAWGWVLRLRVGMEWAWKWVLGLRVGLEVDVGMGLGPARGHGSGQWA